MNKRVVQWTVILAVALIGTAVAVPAYPQEPQMDENFLLLTGARNATKMGNHNLAIIRYRRLLEGSPTLYDARRELGWALIAAGRISEAEEQFQSVLHAHPRDTESWKGLLEAGRKSGKRNEIVQALERLVELEPKRRDLRMQLALELHNRGRFAEAEQHIAVLLGE